MPEAAPDIEAPRREQQLALVAAQHEITLGDPGDCPLPLAELQALGRHHPAVRAVHESGLTAIVYKLHAHGRDWAVKRARPRSLVQNVDGETSFLNELQRRAEFAALKALPGGAARWRGIVDTVYASLRQGVVVSPWIAGSAVHSWNERSLVQLFDTGRELVRAGFFEWDFCPGNVLDDGRQVQLFDFGYMYRFDPLRHFNSAGTGTSVPQCHLAERIETRHVFGWLLDLEQSQGLGATLSAFRMEKAIALDSYERLRSELAQDGAQHSVLAWLDTIVARWRRALNGDLAGLYLQEGWRSHTLDLEDDLHGQTCTPGTLARADWLLAALRDSHAALCTHAVFSTDDAACSRTELLRRYQHKRTLAMALQVPGTP